MKEDSNSLLWVVIIALLLWFGGGFNPIVTTPPPFVAKDAIDSLIVEDSMKRTTDLDALFDAVEASVVAGGGKFRRLSTSQVNLSMEEQWVQDAWKARGNNPPPWIVAANAKTGVNQAIPADKVAAVKLVQQLGGK